MINPVVLKRELWTATYMMTSSNGNIFRVTGPLCGEFTCPGEFPTQRPVTRSFHVFFDLRLNKRLSKQSRGWWFETLSPPLWRHRNELRWVILDVCRETLCALGLLPWLWNDLVENRVTIHTFRLTSINNYLCIQYNAIMGAYVRRNSDKPILNMTDV